MKLPSTILVPLAARLLAIPHRRKPDFVVGSGRDGAGIPYLERWHLIPPNRLCNVYLHHIAASDDNRALHDHPWPSLSIMLLGALREWRFASAHPLHGFSLRHITAGDIVFRVPRLAHRLELEPGREAWTLFLTGPHLREWGFYCPDGWRPWHVFTAAHDRGQIGRGCE